MPWRTITFSPLFALWAWGGSAGGAIALILGIAVVMYWLASYNYNDR